MRLPWIAKKEHDKLMEYKDSIIRGWINKCNRLNEDIEKKECEVITSLNDNMAIVVENESLRIRIRELEENINLYKNNEFKLNIELCRAKGQLNNLDNFIKTATGTSILEGDK